MNQENALDAARKFLLNWIDVKACDKPPEGLYGYDSLKDFLFRVERKDGLYLGGTTYLAVSKATGQVRNVGTVGE